MLTIRVMIAAESFLAELDAQNRVALDRLGIAASAEPGGDVTVARLLFVALKNEIEATECAAGWIATTPEIDVKLALARQTGDEAKHYRLIEKRIGELGLDPRAFDPGPRSPMLGYLASLPLTVERVAAGQFTREAIAVVRNDEFIRFCESRGDPETAALYRDIIQPDERHHHELGRRLLLRLAVSDEAQERARAAAQRTLALAEELQEIARMKAGVSRAPGC
jgi:1,2-phenylacetyl-CoA epoxidase catalytic subunit